MTGAGADRPGVLLADGSDRIKDIDVLVNQDELFGPVASDSALWRTLNELDAPALARVEKARAKTRVRVCPRSALGVLP